MSPESHLPPTTARHVQITVEGKVPDSWSEWLNGMQVSFHKETDGWQYTTLSGYIADQVALRGLLNRLWDLNLTLLSVQTGEPGTGANQK